MQLKWLKWNQLSWQPCLEDLAITYKRTMVSWHWTVCDNAHSRAPLASRLESATTITLLPYLSLPDDSLPTYSTSSALPPPKNSTFWSVSTEFLDTFLRWRDDECTRTREMERLMDSLGDLLCDLAIIFFNLVWERSWLASNLYRRMFNNAAIICLTFKC